MSENKEDKDETNAVHTDEGLKKIAQEMLAGNIFTDRHLDTGVKAHQVFMPILFFDEKQMEEFKTAIEDERIYMIYEYMSEAGPRALNGMPQFMSYRVLNKEQTETVIKYYNKIKETINTMKLEVEKEKD